YERGRPVGIDDAEMAPVLGPDGRPLAARGWWDTESLADQDGTFFVGIERVNRIVRFDFAKLGVRARASVVATPPGISTLPNNRGLEALAIAPRGTRLAGTLIAFSERGLDAAGNLKAFLIGGPTPGDFTVKRLDDFDISDCTVLPGGDILLLERRFSLLRGGIAMRLRRLRLADIKPAALVDGPVLFEADMGYQIDNMEGISTHRTEAGDLILTMVSDDNFSFLQRTILLQFKLYEE
ncbi:MAG: esterase-like activity of phytase family protein, partial [Xanthobacteraceae bacterium]|nr:esterase-like activity of phytase family protein [Xanthobacteraceae bacterium]